MVKKLKTKAATVAGVTVSDQTVVSGGTATFTARIARGTAPYKYQWYREGQAISGATAASYTTPVVTFSDNGTKYVCRVTGINGKYANSNTAMLRVEKAVIKSWNIGAASAGVYYDGTSQGNSNAVATLYEDGTLALTGTGNIMEYDSNSTILPPWCTGEYAFKVTGYTIAPTLTVRSMSIMFKGCANLTRASVIPDGVTTMENAYAGCSALKTVADIPEGVENLSGAFAGCKFLKEAPVIPSSVTNMHNTFIGCTSLQKAPIIPEKVTNMEGTFEGCFSLTTASTIPASVTNLRNVYANCPQLTGDILIKSGADANYSTMFQGSVLIPGASLKVNYTLQNQLIFTSLMQLPNNSNSNITAAGTYVDIADQQISGGRAEFTALTAPGNYTYQWSVRYAGGSSFTDIPGATNYILVLIELTDAQKGNVFRCTVTDQDGSIAYGEASLK